MKVDLHTLSTSLVNFFVGLAESFLVLRFFLKLLGANASNGFVKWVYDMSSVLLDPFRGIFPTRVFDNTYVLEFSTLFAILIYSILGLLLLALIDTIVHSFKTKK